MEEVILKLTDEQAEYAMSLRGELYWQYIEEVTAERG